MGQVDPIHGGAHANDRREEMYLLFRMLMLEAVDQVQLGSNGPFGSRRRGFDRLNDLARGAGNVGQIVHFLRTLWMNQNLDPRKPLPEQTYVFGFEHLVNRAVP